MSRFRFASLESEGYRFPGEHPLERPIVYTPDTLRSLIRFHRQIADFHQTQKPYFEFTNTGAELILDETLANGVSLRVGPIGAFTQAEIAATIQEQTCLYVARGTMGKQFPKDNPEAVAELLSVMMADFCPQRTIVLFEKSTEAGVKPVVGVQASPGSQDIQLLQTMLNNFVQGNGDRKASTLSTLSALRFSKINHELVQFLAEHGSVKESETVSMSRLFATTKEEAKLLDIDIRGYPWIAMAALAIGIHANAQQFSETQPDPKICLYDTHEPGIQDKLEKEFDMHLIERDAVEATEIIARSILRHHYLSKEHGGFQEDICIGYVEIETYLRRAIEYLLKQNIKIPKEYL